MQNLQSRLGRGLALRHDHLMLRLCGSRLPAVAAMNRMAPGEANGAQRVAISARECTGSDL